MASTWCRFAALAALVMLAACGGSSPAAPDSAATTIVNTGPQLLRATMQTPCASRDFLAMIYTRVTVARSGSEWVATASSAASGDVELRFRQSSSVIVANSFQVSGTIRNTAIHLPELIQAPAWDARANFGADGRTTLTGAAFAAGFAGAQTAGLDGQGSGSIVMSDTAGHSCTGTGFSWSVFPQ